MRDRELGIGLIAKTARGPIRAPSQARSRQSMDKVLAATEALLAEKPFDKITVQEIVRRSGIATSSIYARFRDKQALVLGLHLRLREQALDCIERLSDSGRWSGESTARIVATVVPPCVRFYREHGALIRAALTIDSPEMRERQASVLQFAAERFSAIIPAHTSAERQAVNAAVDCAVRIVASIMYSTLIFKDVEMGRRPMPDRELSRQLIRAITALLAAAKSGS